jgi:hypothetical protein
MRIKGSELKRIIREEISRSSGRRIIREGIDMQQLGAAIEQEEEIINALMAKGGVPVLHSERAHLGRYKRLVEHLTKILTKVDEAILPDAEAKGRIVPGFTEFASLGSQSPMARQIMEATNVNADIRYKARAIVAIFGGFTGRLEFARSGIDAYSGGPPVDVFLGDTISFFGHDQGSDPVNLAIKDYGEGDTPVGVRPRRGAVGFVEDVVKLASFDLPRAVEMVSSGRRPPEF